MASATVLDFPQSLQNANVHSHDDSKIGESLLSSAYEWTDKIRKNLLLLGEASNADGTLPNPHVIDESILDIPRRRSADPERATLAALIAQLLYPGPSDSLGPLIKYEADVVKLRKAILQQRKRDIEEATARNSLRSWEDRIRRQGPWNEQEDPLSLNGVSSLPMPVKIAVKETLEPFFDHLQSGGTHLRDSTSRGIEDAVEADEPFYDTQTLEFQKGVVYSDHRMDLCKMVVGHTNIGDLMNSLRTNTFITHFLLGNNIIGPHGAYCIAEFLKEFPNRMDTWYLAGNCIDAPSFELLVDQWTRSTTVTNIWLKRNPLMASSAMNVYRLITETKNLRTLDLDQTELGDAGVAELFSALATHKSETPLALRHIYLNMNGISVRGATAIAEYLSSPSCTITSLYLTNNPLGSAGVVALSNGLKENKTLTRLTLASVGMGDQAATALCSSLVGHPTLTTLEIGHSYATEDLGMRYNWITDRSAFSIANMVQSLRTLRYLSLGYCSISTAGINSILRSVCDSASLEWFNGKTVLPDKRDALEVKARQERVQLLKTAQALFEKNVRKQYGDQLTYDEFLADQKRWLVNDETDVRKIDSVYRNRDAGMARRGLKKLDKWWDEADDTLQEVMAQGPSCSYRKRLAA
ncbi:RNI-like protein [Mytilinidion resinicola]|uniref:RNI-like protein n=1 Tax=Mytilinidion resinicola TaxID=574789 RepID=A0A6A6Z8P3_9PEZI|nr:RNI-like protein [Mytilinidion resinicola]KAF2816655.1 RNI-like protein [Mytilinidion resinicola]